MILSMTGFASNISEIPLSYNNSSMTLAISLKSLNSRYFEMSCKLPSLLHNLEVTIQKMLQKKLHRGHVSLHIKLLNAEQINENIKPALKTIQSYIDAIQIIQENFALQDTITLAQILQLPHALQSEEVQLNEDIEYHVLQAIQQVAEKLIQAQQREGIQLASDLHNQLISMQEKIQAIKTLSLHIIQEKKAELNKILHELATYQNPTELKSVEQCLLEAKKTSLMYEIEKIDINEETVRFASHIDNLAYQFESTEPAKGKKIDFIIQELNREINTIASKCADIKISSLAIDIKADIEKAREQAQNIV